MNDELQKALAEFVRLTVADYQHGKDFVLAQAPDVIQQLIRWHFWEALILGVLLGMVSVAGWIGVVWLCRRGIVAMNSKNYQDDCFPWFLGTGFGGAASLFVMFVSGDNFITALEIYLAPKVWLIEWAMAQVKK